MVFLSSFSFNLPLSPLLLFLSFSSDYLIPKKPGNTIIYSSSFNRSLLQLYSPLVHSNSITFHVLPVPPLPKKKQSKNKNKKKLYCIPISSCQNKSFIIEFYNTLQPLPALESPSHRKCVIDTTNHQIV